MTSVSRKEVSEILDHFLEGKVIKAWALKDTGYTKCYYDLTLFNDAVWTMDGSEVLCFAMGVNSGFIALDADLKEYSKFLRIMHGDT